MRLIHRFDASINKGQMGLEGNLNVAVIGEAARARPPAVRVIISLHMLYCIPIFIVIIICVIYIKYIYMNSGWGSTKK